MDPVILSTRSFEETGNLLSAYLVKFSGALDSALRTVAKRNRFPYLKSMTAPIT